MPDPEQPKEIDFVSLLLVGGTQKEAEESGLKVRYMNKEDSYNANKAVVGNMDISQYDELYKNVYGKELYKTNEEYMNHAVGNKTDVTDIELIYDKRKTVLIHPNVMGYEMQRPHKMYESQAVKGDVGEYYDQKGNKHFTTTAEEMAEIRGVYLKQDGNTGDLSDYQMLDVQRSPFRFDKEGNKKILVLDQRLRAWVEQDGDAVVGSTSQRSMYGPKKAESGIAENMGVQSWNTIVDQTYGATGTVAEMMGTFGKWISGDMDNNSLQKWGLEVQNLAGASKSKVSEAVEAEGAFGSWRAGLGTVSNAITQVASQALVGLVTGGLGNVVGKAGLVGKYAKMALNGAPWAFGAAYAAQAMNDEAKAAGLDDKSRAMMSLLAMGAVYGSEYALKGMGFKGIVDMFDDDALTSQLDKGLREGMKKAALEVKDEITKGLGEDASKKLMTSKLDDLITKQYTSMGINLTEKTKGTMMQNMSKKIASWNYSDKPLSLWSRAVAGTLAGSEEGFEEVIEGGINAFTKTAYNNLWANPDAEPGKGKFENTGLSFTGSLSEFAAGSIGGFPMGFIRGRSKRVNLNKDYAIANLALNMSEEDGEKFLMKLEKAGNLDNPLFDENNNFIQMLPKDQQGKAKSLNNVAYESLRTQLAEAHKIIKLTKLNDADKITKLMGGDMRLAKTALANMLWLKKAEVELADMNAQLGNMIEGSPEHTELTKSIEEKKADMAVLEKSAKETVDGTAVEKYRALAFVKSWKASSRALNNMTSATNTHELINEAYTKPIEELEKEDNWDDMDSALATVKRLQEVSNSFKEAQKEVDAKRKESTDFFELNKDLDFDNMDEAGIMNFLNAVDRHTAGDSATGTKGKAALKTQFSSIFERANKNIKNRIEEKKNERYDKPVFKTAIDEKIQAMADAAGKKLSDYTKLELEAMRKEAISDIESSYEYDGPFEIGAIIDENDKEVKPFTDIESKLKETEGFLHDDSPKLLTQGKKSIVSETNDGDVEHDTNMMGYIDDTYEGFVYEKKGLTGGSVAITKHQFEEEQKAKGVKDDSFSVGANTYTKRAVNEGDKFKGRKIKTKRNVAQEDGTVAEVDTEVLGFRVSDAGQKVIAEKQFQEKILRLFYDSNTEGVDPKSLIEKAEALLKEIQAESEDVMLLLDIIRNGGRMPESMKAWLGVDSSDDVQYDLIAYANMLGNSEAVVQSFLATEKQNTDIREEMLEAYRVHGFKQMATVSNQLDKYFPVKALVVNGVTMKRPTTFDIEIADEVDVLKAMQYWHHYFNSMPKEEFISKFGTFWHFVVMEFGQNPDGTLNMDHPKNPSLGNKSRADTQGNFVTGFDDYINFDFFKERRVDDSYRQMAYYHWMNMLFNMDVADHYKNMFEIIEDGDFSGAHTSEQMLTMLQATTHLHENQNINVAKALNDTDYLEKHGAFKTILKFGASKEFLKKNGHGLYRHPKGLYDGSVIKDNFLLITAPGGAGKTSFIVRSIIEYASETTNKGKKIVLVARNDNMVSGLKDSAKQAGLKDTEYEALTVAQFLEKQHEYENSLIIIDEVSVLSQAEKGSIYFNGVNELANGSIQPIAKRANGTKTEPIKDSNTVFILGDEFQAPHSVEEAKVMPKISTFMQHTISMTQVKRTSYKDIFDIQNMFRMEIAKFGRSALPVLTRPYVWFEGENKRIGVKLEDAELKFWDEAKRVNNIDNAYVIVLDNAGLNIAISNGINADKIKVMTSETNTPQGLTIGEVYVYMPSSMAESPGEKGGTGVSYEIYNKFMGMAVGRAKNFLMVYSAGINHAGSSQVKNEHEVDKFLENPEKEDAKKKVQRERYEKYKNELEVTQPVSGRATVTVENKKPIGNQAPPDPLVPTAPIVSGTGTGRPPIIVPSIVNTPPIFGKIEAPSYPPIIDNTPTEKPKTQKELHEENKKAISKQYPFPSGSTISFKFNGETISGIVTKQKFKSKKSGDVSAEYNFEVQEPGRSTVTKVKVIADSKGVKMESVERGSIAKGDPIEEVKNYDASNGNGVTINDPSTMIVEEKNLIEENITQLLVNDGTGNHVIVQVGATYKLELGGVQVNKAVSSIIKNDDNTYSIKFEKDMRTNKGMSPEIFMSSLRKNLDTDRKIEDARGLTLLYNNRELFFHNIYAPLPLVETSTASNATYLAKQAQSIANIFNASSGTSVTYRVRVVRNEGENKLSFITSGGKVNKDSTYYYVLEYVSKTGETLPVSYIPVWADNAKQTESKDGNEEYYKELYRRADQALKGKEEATVHTGTMDSSKAFNQNSFASYDKTSNKRLSSGQLVDDMKNYGFKLISVEYRKNDSNQMIPTAIFAMDNAGPKSQIAIGLEAKQIADNQDAADKYLDGLIDSLEKTKGDAALISLLGNEGEIGRFHEFNKRQLGSDFAIGFKWMNEAVKNGVLQPDSERGSGEYMKVVGGQKDIQAFKNNMLEFLKALKGNYKNVENNESVKLRFAPTKIGNQFDIKNFTTSTSIFVKSPSITVPLNPNANGLLRENSDKLDAISYDMDTAQATAELDELIGGGSGFEFAPNLLTDENAHGKITAFGKILLNYKSGLVSSKVLYHEVAHYVAEFLIREDARRALYQEAAIKRGFKNYDHDNVEHRKIAAEYFAEAAERFAYDRRNMKGLTKFFTRFLDYLKYIFDRLGIIKNVTHRYMYEIYVNKTFGTNEFESKRASVHEMPYSELFRADDYQSFDKMVSFFGGSRDRALKAAENIAAHAASQVVAPIMNSRMFLDKNISFKDIVNRIENQMRGVVMYETDQDGLIKYYPKGHEFAGMPVLRKDMNGDGMYIYHLGKDYDLFKYEVNPIDEQGRTHMGPTLMYFDRRAGKHIVAKKNNKGIAFSTDSERAYIRGMIRTSFDNFYVETGKLDENGQFVIAKPNTKNREEQLALLQTGSMPDYFNFLHATGAMEDDILAAALNRYFPNVNILELVEGKSKMTMMEALNKLMEQENIITREHANSVNPMDRLSHMLKFILMTAPRYVPKYLDASELQHLDLFEASKRAIEKGYTLTTDNGKYMYEVWVPTPGKMNMEHITKIMIDLVNNNYDPTRSTIDSIRDSIKSELASIEKNYNSPIKASTSEKYVILKSMYEYIYSTEPGSMSHATIMSWQENIAKGNLTIDKAYNQYLNAFEAQKKIGLIDESEPNLTLKQFEQNVENRSNQSAMIVNAITTSFTSIATDKYVRFSIYGDNEDPRVSRRLVSAANENDKKIELEQHILSSMETSSGSISEKYVNLFGLKTNGKELLSPDGGRQPHTIFKADGIYYRSHKGADDVKIIGIENGKLKPVPLSSLPVLFDRETAIGSIMNELFNRTWYKSSKTRLGNETITGSDELGWNDLHKVIGPIALSMYTYSANKYHTDKAATNMPLVPMYEEILKNFKPGSPNYGRLSDESVDAITSTDNNGEVQHIGAIPTDETNPFRPTGYYEELGKIAEMLTQTEGGYMVRFMYDVKNNKKFMDTTMDAMGYHLKDGGKAVGKTFRNRMIEGFIPGNMNHINGKIFNPIFGGERTGSDSYNEKTFVKSLPFIDGIVRGFKGQDISEISAKNDFDMRLWGILPDLNTSATSWAMTEMLISQQTQGERSRQTMAILNWDVNGYKGHRGATNGLFILGTQKKIDGRAYANLTMDSDNIFKHIANIFQMTEKVQVESYNRWAKFVMKHAKTPVVNVGTNFTLTADYKLDITSPNIAAEKDALKQFLLDYIKNMNAVAGDNGFGIIPGTETVSAFDGTDMIKGIDYIFVKDKNGATGIYFGHGLSMNSAVALRNEITKSHPEKIFNNHNFTKKNHKIPVNINGEKATVKVSIEDLIRTMDDNGDVYVTYYDHINIPQTVKVDAITKKKILLNLFKNQLKATDDNAKKFGYGLYNSNTSLTGQPMKSGSNYNAGIKVNSKTYYEPWAVYEMAHKIWNMYFQYAFEGSMGQETDSRVNFEKEGGLKWSSNNNKRSMMHSSTMTKTTFGGYHGMDDEGVNITITQVTMEAQIDGVTSIKSNKHVTFDGQDWSSKLDAVMEYHAAGGEYGGFSRNAMTKNQGIVIDDRTGESIKMKHALHVPSYQSMQYMPEERLMQEMLHNPYARQVIEGDQLLISKVRKWSDIPFEKDSLWQRYVIHELESKYYDAVEAMENFIENNGGLDEYVKSAYDAETKNPDDITRILTDINNVKKDSTLYEYHNLLSMLFDKAGDEEYIESPNVAVDYEWAWDKVADFYKLQRAQGNAGVNKNYMYIKAVLQNDAGLKQQALHQSVPMAFEFSGRSNDVRPLMHLATPSGLVPSTIQEAYMMWKQEGLDMPVNMYTSRFNNNYIGRQLNANRDVDDATEAPMVQIMNIILASPEQHKNGKSKKMMDLIANGIRTALTKFVAEELDFKTDQVIEGSTASENALIEKFIKSKVKMSMSDIDDGSMLSVIVNNDQININVSEGAQTRVYQYLASYLRKEAVKRRQSAMRLVQVGGNNTHLYRFTHQDGSVEAFSFADAVKYGTRVLKLKIPIANQSTVDEYLLENGFEKGTLKNTTIKLGKEITPEAQAILDTLPANKHTEWLINNDFAIVEKGEILVPAPKYDKYKIPKHTTYNELFRLLVKDGDNYIDFNLRDMSFNGKQRRGELKATIADTVKKSLLFRFMQGKKASYVKSGYTDAMVKGDNPYFDSLFGSTSDAWVKTNKKLIVKYTEEADDKLRKLAKGTKGYEQKYKTDGVYNDAYYEAMSTIVTELISNDDTFKEAMSQAVEMYTNGLIATGLAANQTVGIRTPSGPGSGFFVEVVGFVNDNGSVGYVNTIKNMIDGSDQDIDQFTLYYKEDTLDELGYSKEDQAEIMKSWLEDGVQGSRYNKNWYDEELNKINNNLQDYIFDFYGNPKNNILTGSAIELDAIKEIAAENEYKLMPNGDVAHGVGHSTLYRRASFDGQAVGVFANAQKAQTWLATAFYENGSRADTFSDKYNMSFGLDEYSVIPKRLEALLNAATDNKKIMALGMMNVNLSNGTMVATSVLASKEIMEFVIKNPTRFGLTVEKIEELMQDPDYAFERILYRFYTGQAFTDIMNFSERSKDIMTFEKTQTLFQSAHKYYSILGKVENLKDNKLKSDEAIRNIETAESQIRETLREVFDFEETEIAEMLMTDNGKVDIKSIIKLAMKSNKPKYKALVAALQNEVSGLIGEEDEEGTMSADIKSVKDALSKGFIETLISQGIDPSTKEQELIILLKQYDALGDDLGNLISLLRFRNAQQYAIDKVSKKLDTKYHEEVFIIAKYAMLAEWMSGVATIVGLNQFKISSPYEAFKYNKNLKYMSGLDVNEVLAVYDEYVKALETNPNLTAHEFLKDNPTNLTPQQQWEVVEKQMQHTFAQNEYAHITDNIEIERIENGEVKTEVINFASQFHEIGNILELMLSSPNTMETMRALKILEDHREAMFSTSKKVFTDIMKDILYDTGQDFFNEGKYIEFHGEINNYLTSMFLSDNKKIAQILEESLRACGDKHGNNYGGKPLVGIDGIGRIPSIRSAEARRDFIQQIPAFYNSFLQNYLVQLIEEGYFDNKKEAKELIERLFVKTKGSMQYIEINNPTSNSPDDLNRMRQGFKDLPDHVKNILAIYQITKSGFEYQKGFLAKVMPEEYYVMYSDFLDELELKESYITPQQSQSLKEQLLYNPNLGFLRNESKIKIGNEWLSVPPIASYGYARVFAKQVYKSGWGRFGTVEIKASAVTKDSPYVMSGKSKSLKEEGNRLPASLILDINAETIPEGYKTVSFDFFEQYVDTSKMSMSSYMHYIIKGNFEKMYMNEIKELISNNIEPDEKTLKAVIENLWKNVLADKRKYNENYGSISFNTIDGVKETFTEAQERVSNEWHKIIATKLRQKYSPEQFMELYERAKGKIITSGTVRTMLSSAWVLSNILNITSGDVNILGKINKTPDAEDTFKTPEVDLYINRLTSLGNTYDKNTTDAVIIKMRVGSANNLFKDIYQKSSKELWMERFSKERRDHDLMLGSVIAHAFYNPEYSAKKFVTDRYGVNENERLAFVSTAMNNVDVWAEREIDSSKLMTNRQTVIAMKNAISKNNGIITNIMQYALPLKRSKKTPYKVGDIIYFGQEHRAVIVGLSGEIYDDFDNIVGYRNASYVLDPNYKSGQSYRAVTSIEDHIGQNNAIRTIESAVRTFAKSMPNIPYEFINNDEAAALGETGSASFFKNGTVYINTERADVAVVLHEFAHPFTMALETENPELWNRLASLVANNEQVINFVRNNYPELTTDIEIIREAIPTFLQMRMYATMWAEQSAEERESWKDYFNWVGNTFSDAMYDVSTDVNSLTELDWKNASLVQMADAILNDFKAGRVLSLSTNAQHMMPYTMKASSSSKMKNISMANIDKLFQNRAELTEDEEARTYITAAVDNSVAAGSTFNGISGSYSFSYNNPAYITDGTFSQAKYDEARNKAIKNEMAFFTGMDEKMLTFFARLNETNVSPLAAAMSTIYTSWEKRYKTADISDAKREELNDRIERMLIHIGFDHKTDKAMSLSQAATHLGIKLPTNISGNPIVIIHDFGQPAQAISFINVTTIGLMSHGVGDMQILGDSFVDSEELTRKDRKKMRSVTLMNTNQDINAFKNAVIAMAFKKENPALNIRKVGTVRITGDGYQRHFKRMEDIVVPMKNLFGVTYFKENLERDLYDLVSDESLLNPETYKQDTLEKLKDYAATALSQTKDKKDVVHLQEMLDTVAHVAGDHLQTKSKELARMIRSRLSYLRNQVFGNNKDLISKSEEYQELATMYMELTSYNDVGVEKVTPIDFDELWLKTADRWHGKVRTWVFDSLDTAMRKSKEMIMPFQAELNDWVDTLNKANPQLSKMKDGSHELFKKIFKTMKVKDKKSGQMIDVSTHEIHWNENDLETKRLLDSNKLTRTELAFGKWLADKMHEEFVQYIMDVERSSIAKGNDTEEELRVKAERMVSQRYKKGMMPVFTRSFGSALSEGKLSEAVNLFTKNAGKWYGGNIYTDYQQSDVNDDAVDGTFQELLSPFWNQFTSVSAMGGKDRMYLLGLGYEGDQVVLLENERNENISYNLQNIGLFTKAASTRARTMKEGIANVNIALDILRGEQETKGTKTDDIITQLENYVNRQVYGNMPTHGKLQVIGAALNIDNMLDASGKLIHMIHLAVNPMIGAKNLVSSAMKGFISSMTNALSGSKMFNTSDVTKALIEVVSNPKKVEMINRKYQMVNITERDLLNHFKNNMSRANITETDFQMMFHWFGDHYTQLIGAVAQMMSDGTYDAHDENGNYDQTKDKRFDDVNGTLIKEDIIRQQILEGYHATDGSKMTHAYSQRDEARIKLITQRFVGELNDNQYKNMASSYGVARAMMNLKNYMYNLKQVWWSERRPEVWLGGRAVQEDTSGNKKVVWEPVMAEGILQTIVYLVTAVGSKEKFQLDMYRKRNLLTAGVTLATLAGIYFLVDALSEGFDDDDDKRKKKGGESGGGGASSSWEDGNVFYGQRLIGQLLGAGYNVKKDSKELNYAQQVFRYIIGGAANEQLGHGNPIKMLKDFYDNPSTYWMQIENIFAAFTGTLALPFHMATDTDKTGMWEDIDKWAYTVSKNIPYGSNYRVMHDAIIQLLKDYQSFEKQ